MGSGLFSGPPTNGSEPPVDWPVSDYIKEAEAQAKGLKNAHWYDFLWLALHKWFFEGLGIVIGFFVGGMDEIMGMALGVILKAQGINQPGTVALMAHVLGDLLGLEINQEQLLASWTRHGRLGAMQSVGASLYNTLEGEFAPPGSAIPLQPSVAPAERFMGFLIEFAIREGNLSMLSELIPEQYNFMGGLREYGETLARYLGLGRLARQAFRPLMQTLVADPLQKALHLKYRPTGLSMAQAYKAYSHGVLTQADFEHVLATHGYSKENINLLYYDLAPEIPLGDGYLMAKFQGFSQDQLITQIQGKGFPKDVAPKIWQAEKDRHINSLLNTYLNEIKTQYGQGLIDDATVDNIFSDLPLLPDEREWWLRIIHSQIPKEPRIKPRRPVHMRHLSEGQLEHAFLEGILTLTQVQDYWLFLGYYPDDLQTLTLLLLARQAAGRRTTSGHVPHRQLTESELTKAYKAGIMDLAAVQAYWHNLGYSQADVNVLTQLLTAAPAPAA
jgi:hypothetical protein